MPATLSDKAKAFLAKKPVVLGVSGDTTFYECPTLGEESPMLFIDQEGKLRRSEFWDMDSVMESMWNDIGRDC